MCLYYILWGVNMTIRKKFIIFSILWGIVPVIVLTGLYIMKFRDKGVELIKQNVATSTNDQSVHLEAFFEQNIANINAISNMPEIQNLLVSSNDEVNIENHQGSVAVLNEFFNIQKNEQQFVISELLFNRYGAIIASTDNAELSHEVLLSEDEMKRLQQNEVVVTNIIQKPNINNGAKSAIIANPIFFEDKYQGSIAAVINMHYFESLVSRTKPFRSGKIAIMDENGVIAASSSNDVKEDISKINSVNDLYEQWKGIDFDNNPNGVIQYKINGIEKVGSYSRIKNTKWIVLCGIQLSDLKEPPNKTNYDISIFVILFLSLVISSYLFIINYFSKPMFLLLESMRKIREGNYKDRFIYNKNDEFGEIAVAFNKLIDTIQKSKKHMDNKNRQLQSLTSNIPGGVHRNIIVDGEHYMDFLSSGCLNLMGYKRNEFKKVFGKRIFDVIYEEDRERVEKEIKEQIEKCGKFTVEYRIKRKDGSIIWLLDNGRIVKDRDGKTFSYNVAMNITDAKLAQEELRLSEERYRIITSQTDDIIFEWNVKEDTIFYSGNLENRFDSKSSFTELTKKIYESDLIHKDDVKIFSEILSSIINGDPYKENEIRMRRSTGIYNWYKMRITAIFDANSNISRAIGVVSDIDKEKKEAEELLFKAQRDSLTALYNKGTTESLIQEYIENEGRNAGGALLLIDMDNFKSINDNLGHLAGDFVLTNLSSMLSDIFKGNSIIGRIGGDEFIIFIKDINSEEMIHKKAEELVNGFRTNFTSEFENYKVSGSIGIAKYPEHGTRFEQLYINADKATYLAKHKGKDNYCIFRECE